MIRIETETHNDGLARERLLDRAMGADRTLKPSEKLRAGRLPAEGLALVARDGDRLVGSVRLWHVAAGGRPALLLGPLAIDPALQGRGVGGGLMQVALNRAALAGHKAVILVGDPEYYERFGFTRSTVGGLVMPGPGRSPPFPRHRPFHRRARRGRGPGDRDRRARPGCRAPGRGVADHGSVNAIRPVSRWPDRRGLLCAPPRGVESEEDDDSETDHDCLDFGRRTARRGDARRAGAGRGDDLLHFEHRLG